MIDGAVARARTSTNSSGALLDSVIDRYSEAVIFLGALIYFHHLQNFFGVVLVFAAVIGSILVSYVRARAEGLQIECKVGLMQRPERIVLLALGCADTRGYPGSVYTLAIKGDDSLRCIRTPCRDRAYHRYPTTCLLFLQTERSLSQWSQTHTPHMSSGCRLRIKIGISDTRTMKMPAPAR